MENSVTIRKCNVCHDDYPLTDKYFSKDKNRKHGYSYRCKSCDKAKGKLQHAKNPRKGRYSKMTKEQKSKKLSWARKYRRTIKGRAIHLLNAYRDADRIAGRKGFNLTTAFMEDKLSQICVYCTETDFNKLGLDRVDNKGAHSQDNVVTCCDECNCARSDHFTFTEMFVIGDAIRRVKSKRMHFSLYGE